MPKYRKYIDEAGNSDMGSCENPNHRFLGLTGVILSLDDVRNLLVPELDRLKACYFRGDPDDPPIFHRKELVNRHPPFHALRNPTIEHNFNADLLNLLDALPFTVVSVVIDKLEHRDRYSTWRYDPYHYCLAVLLERYVLLLDRVGAHGDVMAEARGGQEDMRLKRSFRALCENGTDYIKADRFGEVLSSFEIKMCPKTRNIAGLQLADLLAHPCRQHILARYRAIEKSGRTFGDEIMALLIRSKFYRGRYGKILGFGMKFLP